MTLNILAQLKSVALITRFVRLYRLSFPKASNKPSKNLFILQVIITVSETKPLTSHSCTNIQFSSYSQKNVLSGPLAIFFFATLLSTLTARSGKTGKHKPVALMITLCKAKEVTREAFAFGLILH